MTSARIAATPVQNVKTIDTASGRVGYLQFNDHVAPAEAQLIAAVNQFKSAGIADLVLDMRYNGGGLLPIASELAYMVATARRHAGHHLRAPPVQRQEPVQADRRRQRRCPSTAVRAAFRPPPASRCRSWG